ncbi:hypothetical protein Pelo_16435 [Pelomyxa schiedti]|nr:hypothetical protein Pelo_16435 [Pelomyxa schiedti]
MAQQLRLRSMVVEPQSISGTTVNVLEFVHEQPPPPTDKQCLLCNDKPLIRTTTKTPITSQEPSVTSSHTSSDTSQTAAATTPTSAATPATSTAAAVSVPIIPHEKEDNEYVYDVFYHDSAANIDELKNVPWIQIQSFAGDLIEDDDEDDDGLEDLDSNDEGNPNNSYPDTEETGSDDSDQEESEDSDENTDEDLFTKPKKHHFYNKKSTDDEEEEDDEEGGVDDDSEDEDEYANYYYDNGGHTGNELRIDPGSSSEDDEG